MPTVRIATIRDLPLLVPLFDAYRQFYGQPSNPELGRAFLAERLKHGESVIVMAFSEDGSALGFTQLYPMFSSVSVGRTYVLNDLFVAAAARRKGVAGALLSEAANYARAAGAVRLSLATAHTNQAAQRLYEAIGWKLDETFRYYYLQIGARPAHTARDSSD